MAKYLKRYLEENQILNCRGENGGNCSYSQKYEINLTDTECNFINVAEKLLGKKVEISKIEL